MPSYKVVCNEAQLAVISAACETYARLAMGQFDMVLSTALAHREIPAVQYCEARDLLDEAGKLVWGRGGGHPGIRSREIHDSARAAWDIHATARQVLAYQRTPEGGHGVCFDDPMQSSEQPLPEVTPTDDSPDPRPIQERMRDELVELLDCPPGAFDVALTRVKEWKAAYDRQQKGGGR